jgi:hypothetical protein
MIDQVIVGRDKFKEIYQTRQNNCKNKTWITCKLNNGQEIFLLEDNDVRLIKKYCLLNNARLTKIGLKFRSHQIYLENDIDNDGFYIVKSVRGSMGGANKYCIVLGSIHGKRVKKQAYVTPELVVLYEDEDDVERCFEEALIYHDQGQTKTL